MTCVQDCQREAELEKRIMELEAALLTAARRFEMLAARSDEMVNGVVPSVGAKECLAAVGDDASDCATHNAPAMPAGECDCLTAPAYGLPQMPRAADSGRLRFDLSSVLNRHSRENGSNTPDFILAQYIANCLDAYDLAIGQRAQWYGRIDSIGGPREVPRVAIEQDD